MNCQSCPPSWTVNHHPMNYQSSTYEPWPITPWTINHLPMNLESYTHKPSTIMPSLSLSLSPDSLSKGWNYFKISFSNTIKNIPAKPEDIIARNVFVDFPGDFMANCRAAHKLFMIISQIGWCTQRLGCSRDQDIARWKHIYRRHHKQTPRKISEIYKALPSKHKLLTSPQGSLPSVQLCSSMFSHPYGIFASFVHNIT